MEISVDVKELQTRKIFVATPMYGGLCHGYYTRSSVELSKICQHYGIQIEFFYIFNESLITRARNYCVDEFLRHEDFTHLMFIDSDIGFNPQDVLILAALADPNSDKDIICAPYPKKTIAWEKIKKAVDRGAADNNPHDLNNYVGDYVLNPVKGSETIQLDQPVEVLEGGTGFMMIQRNAFIQFADAYPELKYLPDHVRTKHFDGTREITAFFDTVIEPESRRYLSEDYMFCQWARNIGLKVWMAPWMQLNHVGTYNFGGSLAALAQVGASATVDAKEKLR